MSLNEKENQAISEFSRILREKYGDNIKQILLYGSKARGEGGEFSDIDLFVLVEKEDRQLRRFVSEIAYEMDLKYDVVLSAIVCGQAKVETPLCKIMPFFNNVFREGISR